MTWPLKDGSDMDNKEQDVIKNKVILVHISYIEFLTKR